jgi:outer membrane protein OmpA-like peptidoglycan-associated protein
MSRTQKGALIGAVAGAVAGLLSGDDATERRQRALVGAGVGGLAGGAIGRYQDNQERALRERMAGTGVEVVRDGDNITLDMPEAITFGFDSYALRPGSYSVLNRVADTLAEFDQTIVEVAGHTDSIGARVYNLRLSEQRAQAVANYLTSRGINGERMMITGAGSQYPVASNETEAGRAENRRVEITLVPIRS